MAGGAEIYLNPQAPSKKIRKSQQGERRSSMMRTNKNIAFLAPLMFLLLRYG
jgi:hypothetical protein